jgi:hypothetical protein
MKRSKHSLSHRKLFSCDMSKLIPIGVYEVLPGDTCQQATNLLVRASPLLAPVMHPVDVRVHHWFVPYRLIWEDWEDFITGGEDGMDSSTFPTITLEASVGDLADYFGIPTGVADLEVSALPFRAYNLIFNEWYRDQDLVTAKAISVAEGADTTTDTDLLSIAWEKDYFTSSRPWEQKGPSIEVPVGGDAPVDFSGATGGVQLSANGDPVKVGSQESGVNYHIAGDGASIAADEDLEITGADLAASDLSGIVADLSSATGVDINTFREAFALQRFQEARARYGSRFTEYLRYLGVRSSDARLQRPEYMGGGRQTIQFSEVLQTAEGTDPVGDLKGHGISALRSNRYRRFFEEHGLVMTLYSVRPKTIYATGLHRMWNRRTKEDFWQKELQHIGQQAVLNKEVYADHTTPDGTFGYQDRYDEYRRQPSSIAGEFRTVLDHWHLARIFTSDPALNASFVTCDATERVFAVPSQHVLWNRADHSIQARRIIAKIGSSFLM